MATQAKALDKQTSRQELLEAFKLFDVDGDGEVIHLKVIIHKIYQNPFYITSIKTSRIFYAIYHRKF